MIDMSRKDSVECISCKQVISQDSAWNIKLGTEHKPFCSRECAMDMIEKHIIDQMELTKYLFGKLNEVRKWK